MLCQVTTSDPCKGFLPQNGDIQTRHAPPITTQIILRRRFSNKEWPRFVVLGNNQGVKGGPVNWSAGFLPTSYQGTLFRSQGSPILNLKPPADVSREQNKRSFDLVKKLNDERARKLIFGRVGSGHIGGDGAIPL